MTLFRTLRYAALPALLALGVTSCLNPPDYPETPSIEFKGITKQRMTGPNGTADFDRVVISVNYKDGDGDLGLRDTELQPPYNTNNPDGSLNPDGYNYLCRLQVKDNNNQFNDVVFPPNEPGYDGRYPFLTPSSQGDRAAPLRGTIDYEQDLFKNSILRTGTTLRFRIRIKDRALHVSNEVFTTPITLE